MTRMSSDRMEAALQAGSWNTLEIQVAGRSFVTIALVCPLCSAVVPAELRAHHIAWHIEGVH